MDAEAAGMAAELVAPEADLEPLPMRISGRTAAGPRDTLLQEWPAFHVEARFTGTDVSVRFQDVTNRWRITLDGGDHVEISQPGAQDLRISNLTAGEHRIRVEKISESSMPAGFGGILIGGRSSALPSPEPAARLIEFIGDSDTVGFANTSNTRDCSEDEVFAATDTSRSFGPQVATMLGADYRVIARSGIGLLRNYGGASPETTMPSRYPLALPSDPAAARMPQPPADIVVTGIGSNDFGSDFGPDEPWADQAALSAAFGPALTEFVRARVRENPGALQVLLAFGEYGDPLVTPYRAAEAALKADGTRVLLVVLPKLERKACLWHPSAKDHDMIASRLVAAIEGAGA
ncbi:SGNH/GDSL hydrolase family protein [Paracoccus laeviglucosivorans]|uniref:GDSL-like Lipase/Acylhydrolase family protein n=1 Tax=Paracoccus laeviglucosivorans TaxID=1197861 RepID=A0A521BRC5_9RHOB|nr:SGNH/GDSL hydrolase family protein [Paracoccus laeviglucosivorans]SMO49663.1 GDSL-like Lipase/Acylhydrolase family protein [Paracoccus laeviglucosivorans]